MKNLLCSNFAYIFLRQAVKSGSDITGNWKWLQPEKKGSYSKTSQKTDAGIMITETLTAELRDTDAQELLSYPGEPVILKISVTGGDMQMGDDEYPVFFTYTGDTYLKKFTFTAQSAG